MGKAKKNKSKGKPESKVTPESRMEIIAVTIDDPEFSYSHEDGKLGNRRKSPAIANVRESPVAWMFKHDQLEVHQLEAANKFRKYYERTGGTIQAMDTTKEPVDGGKVTDGLTDRKLHSAKELALAEKKLGKQGYKLVEQVCGECLWLNQIEPTKHYQRLAGRRLRESLDTLAFFWNLSSVNTHRKAS